ncbi:carboxyltransferase subunit alpha [Convivina intestini]|uniref:acetyl-CoA carboxytransferase n=1 Tax=Convivina intestini TaxID=1505726 RepID=A0A2U1D7Q7_9LACO|nr:carboxyltransferase subunit alpha [Convivina intestini]PVY83708.1 acetyl-CoA carboxylase carboxyl transferase subunit alpha [Convivina intestini]CAH1855140.1 Acetyl-coenzyme A carboxylase carboxyl transferase subunit alpha [Convivina intestini]SDB92274.1 acetyl-CoA carboxylase carboxyl transferase subunit alpha [Leuconostocaceae bacterium R-53105]
MADLLGFLFKHDVAPAEVVKRSREDRFFARELIDGLFTDFIELHGDRLGGGDDESVIGGIAMLGNRPVTVIAIDKGIDINDKLSKRNGSPQPWGYRKAQRLMKQAEKFHRPIITFINTPGAFPGKEAEAQGQGDAIAQSILESMKLTVPMIAIIYGEGGSGGALALATADQVWMFENATYSILSPEGFASILWKDSKRSDEAAGIMGLTPKDLLEKHVIEYVIPENRHHAKVFSALSAKLTTEINQLEQVGGQELVKMRRARFRAF